MQRVLWLATALSMVVSGAVSGDVIIAYEAALRDNPADVDVVARLLKSDGTLGWAGAEAAPTTIGASDDVETSPVVIADGMGGAFVIYEYEFAEGEHQGDMDIAAQRVSSDGACVWGEGERPIPVASSAGRESRPVAVPDGAGGFIVAYEWADADGDVDVLAQRVNADGELLWYRDETPAIAGASPSPERNPVVVPDGAGGALVLFEWEGEAGTDIMAQHIGADGTALWNGGEQALDVCASPQSERAVVAATDGEGGAIAAFELEFTEGEFKGDVDVMAQRITGDGVLSWNGGGEPVAVGSGKGIERAPRLVADGAGGAILVLEYEPLEGDFAGDIDILAQRLNGEGKPLWGEENAPLSVCSAEGLERAAAVLPDAEGGVFVVAEHEFRAGEHAGDIDIIAQRVSADGRLIWSNGEQSAIVGGAEWLERAPIPLPDGEGGLIVVLSAIGTEGEFEGDEDIWAARVSAAGELLWNGGERSAEVAGSQETERKPSAAVAR